MGPEGPEGPEGPAGADADDDAIFVRLCAEMRLAGMTEGCVRRVFITSSRHDGDVGGLAGADAICQAEADDAGLSGTYYAFLSTSGNDEPRDRFNRSPLPYVRPDGVQIARDWAEFTGGRFAVSIFMDAGGNITPVDGGVMTSTNANGSFNASGDRCDGFTNNAADGRAIGFTTGRSLAPNALINCSTRRHNLLCVQQ